MQDYLLPSEIVNSEGKLIANGVRISNGAGFVGAHVDSNRQIGLGLHAYFMIDFPCTFGEKCCPISART